MTDKDGGRIIKISELSWDYAIRGLLDGTLATLGVVIGARGAAPAIIIAAGISGGVANSLSNVLAAFSAQRATMLQDLREIENAMVDKELEDTSPYRKSSKEVQLKSIMDGVATIIGALVPVLPYFFLPPIAAMYTAIGITALLGFWVGFFMGKLSKQNVLYLGLKMAVIAIVVAGASTLLQNLLSTTLKSGV